MTLLLALALGCAKREAASPLSASTAVSQASRTVEIGRLPAMSFVRIEAGTFEMGLEKSDSFDQGPVHPVTISRAFEMLTTEVTQAQWTEVTGTNPSHFRGDDLPVEQVSWDDVQGFLAHLNRLDPGRRYRLPTESEWEYACRAGSKELRYGDVHEVAWFIKNSENRTHPVGRKSPNAWGLHDMLGNVWELCADWKDSYPAGAVRDPAGPAKGYYKVSRGGSWFDAARAVTATFRSSPETTYRGSSLGFRIVRDPAR